ncbi:MULTISPECIES: sensor histidine kinase [Caproicibacterium]|uniref:Histidine kinase n=1 Tax=Caproicibacterium argilliputei TaxID=3030016 RepID=A0AA97D9E5_9FIRM|nr:histidine kinase [Caproicibacterium argilliputei]WOC32681.1 histidine kinase [Caproicibacterium argilliputei]
MQQRKHRISQRTRLFLVYGTFITVVLVLLFSYIYYFNRQTVQKEAAVKQANVCASVRDSVKTELDNMSTISLNLVYSSAIRENFSSFAAYTEKKNVSKQETLQSWNNAKAIYDVITAMIGSFQSASQVNLYTMDGTRVGSGYQQGVVKMKLSDIPWYSQVYALNGFKYISTPTVNTYLPASGPNQSTHKFLSMARLFFNEGAEPEGIFEVVQDCNTVFSLATKMEQTNEGMHLYVYNACGELMYPYAAAAPQDNYLALAQQKHLPNETTCTVQGADRSSQILTKDTVPNYEWTVLAVESKDSVFTSLSVFRSVFFLLAAGIILGTMVVCFLFAKQMTQPLLKLTRATKKLTMARVLDDSKPVLTSADSSIAEISDLCTSFLTMYDRLRKSSRDLLLSRSEEIRANLRATQSLINPHFLYNSLTSISILAEDGEDTSIVRMCNALCDYFRYIADTARTLVPLQEELACTGKYIACMQIRFGKTFSYTCEVQPQAQNVLIPKLIVQPLVENAFKYAFNNAPPWRLHLCATAENGHWQIRIEDNGGSLSDQTRDEILQELAQMDYTEELHNLHIGGMGLKSTYLRLSLQYGQDAVFNIDNSQKEKTVFLIGGSIEREEEACHGSTIDV